MKFAEHWKIIDKQKRCDEKVTAFFLIKVYVIVNFLYNFTWIINTYYQSIKFFPM